MIQELLNLFGPFQSARKARKYAQKLKLELSMFPSSSLIFIFFSKNGEETEIVVGEGGKLGG